MALNPSTKYPGRITAPDANYTYGSSKNETSPGAGDGTPYEIARANDVFGFQQALLRLAGIVPTGNAETQLAAQYLQALVELSAGRAVNYDESGIANAYVLDLRSGQQGPAGYFDGMISEFFPTVDNTGASTANIGTLGVKNIFFNGAALTGGELSTTKKAKLEYDVVNDRVNLESSASAPTGDIPSGSLMLFQQTAAPTGWTKEVTHNNKALRVVTGAAGVGGTDNFTTVFGAGKVSGAHVLTIGEMPAHTHTVQDGDGTAGITGVDGEVDAAASTIPTNSTGGGGGHTHTLPIDLQFVDLIICSKV